MSGDKFISLLILYEQISRDVPSLISIIILFLIFPRLGRSFGGYTPAVLPRYANELFATIQDPLPSTCSSTTHHTIILIVSKQYKYKLASFVKQIYFFLFAHSDTSIIRRGIQPRSWWIRLPSRDSLELLIELLLILLHILLPVCSLTFYVSTMLYLEINKKWLTWFEAQTFFLSRFHNFKCTGK